MEFIANNWHLFVALLVVLFLLFGSQISQAMHGIKSVGSSQAVLLINRDKGVVVDVREVKEFEEGHIPGAVNLPLSQLASRAGELNRYKQQPVVVACRSGHRSVRGAVMLRKQGFETVYNLQGGLLAWERDNLPTEK